MIISDKQMWNRFDKLPDNNCCHVCGKTINRGEDGIGYIKTKQRTELFFHKKCIKKH